MTTRLTIPVIRFDTQTLEDAVTPPGMQRHCLIPPSTRDSWPVHGPVVGDDVKLVPPPRAADELRLIRSSTLRSAKAGLTVLRGREGLEPEGDDAKEGKKRREREGERKGHGEREGR